MSILAEPDFPSIVHVSPPSSLIYSQHNSSRTPAIMTSSALSPRLGVLQNQVGRLAACPDLYAHAHAHTKAYLVDLAATVTVVSAIPFVFCLPSDRRRQKPT